MNCLVTGASSGLGKALALGLAKSGATVVMLCREADRGRKARIELIARSQNPNIDLMVCDLSAPDDVHRFADEFKSFYPQLHILGNMAGVYFPWRKRTGEGHEYNLATNILGPFLLTNLLIDLLIDSGPSQIINVSGEAHRTGLLDFHQPDLRGRFSIYDANNQAALARVIWTYELARRLQGSPVTVNTFCPGRARTNLYRHLPLPFRLPVWAMNRLFGATPEEAMAPVLDLLLGARQPSLSGQYYVKGKAERSVPITYDREVGQQLFSICEEKTGYRCPAPAFQEDRRLVSP